MGPLSHYGQGRGPGPETTQLAWALTQEGGSTHLHGTDHTRPVSFT